MHYHVTIELPGYLPSHNEVYETSTEALDALKDLADIYYEGLIREEPDYLEWENGEIATVWQCYESDCFSELGVEE